MMSDIRGRDPHNINNGWLMADVFWLILSFLNFIRFKSMKLPITMPGLRYAPQVKIVDITYASTHLLNKRPFDVGKCKLQSGVASQKPLVFQISKKRAASTDSFPQSE